MKTIEQAIPIAALERTHRDHGAMMIERDGRSVPASYGDVLFEYAAVREGGAGFIDLSSRGRLLVSGAEAVQFLNGLITNDVKTLEQNRWMPAAFPNVQGRLIASVRVIHCQAFRVPALAGTFVDGFLIDTEPTTHEAVLKTLNRFTLAGDFRVTDLSDDTALISIQGAKAVEIASRVLGGATAASEDSAVSIIQWDNEQVTIIRATHTAEDGLDLFVGANQASPLWDALRTAGARPVGFEAWEILRIEAGEPRHGIDMDESTVVTEANLDDAVSYTKGCYLGQEIIARIKYRGHVAKKLTGLMFGRAVRVESGARIKSADQKEIGRITSVTLSPHLGRTIALGYVKYDHLAPGTNVKVVSGDHECQAEVIELPFVRRAGDSGAEVANGNE
jgi:folate-binding protein YgfZ